MPASIVRIEYGGVSGYQGTVPWTWVPSGAFVGNPNFRTEGYGSVLPPSPPRPRLDFFPSV